MTLPASGAISLRDVNVELGLPIGNPISLNDTAVRTLFGKPSGAISLADGYGKSSTIFAFNPNNAFVYSVSGNGEFGEGSIVLESSGLISYTNSNGVPVPGTSPTAFLSPSGVGLGSGYSARFEGTVTSGYAQSILGTSAVTGAVSTPWVVLSVNRSIGASADTYSSPTYAQITGTLYIRNDATLVVISKPLDIYASA